MIEFEDTDDVVIPIERSHLVQRRCAGCGGVALAAETYAGVARCGGCLRVHADATARVPEALGVGLAGGIKLGQGYPPVAAAEREAFPEPLVTSRDPWDGAGAPSAVVKLAEKAVAASWDARVQRSRGCAPHATHGRAGAVKWWYAVVLGNGEYSGYAVHDGGGWSSVMLWGRNRPWFAGASVTDLGEYIAAGGAMDDQWYAGIRERERSKVDRAKVRAACNRGSHAEVESRDKMTHCSLCGNTWESSKAAWRVTKSGSGEAL